MLHKSPCDGVSPHPSAGLRPTPSRASPLWKPFYRSPLGRGAGRSCPVGPDQDFGDATRGKGFAWAEKFLLNAASGCKIFLPPFRFIGPDAEMKCQVRRRRPRSGLTLTRDEPRTLLLERGERLQGFPSCPAVSVKMGCGGFAPCWGVGASPTSTKFSERSEWQNTL